MRTYYINKNTDANGNHEVHTEDCIYLPIEFNRHYIGYFSTCNEAISTAKREYPTWKIDGCYYCSKACHHG